jgi:hypothetical protein
MLLTYTDLLTVPLFTADVYIPALRKDKVTTTNGSHHTILDKTISDVSRK